MTARKSLTLLCGCLISAGQLTAQMAWTNVDSLFAPLPPSVHVWFTDDSLDGKPNRAYYVEARLADRELIFDADTASGRGLTPAQYFQRNNSPLLVVNCTFFSARRQNVNLVVDEKRLVSFNQPSVYSIKDSIYHYVTRSAIGIDRRRHADVAWLYTDSVRKKAYELKKGPVVATGSEYHISRKQLRKTEQSPVFRRWKAVTAVGGGPNLLSEGELNITNEEERMFTGKAISDRHPRTAMGYTEDGYLIIMVIEGRNRGVAEGATLEQEAELLKDIGCVEALNLDGGGSSCMLINGKETIKPSDIAGQRPVPAVFIIKKNR